MELVIPALYALAFILIIYRIRFFQVHGLTARSVSAVFILKILCGVGMALLYTYYYTDRTTADIFKYYDDSAVMYDALYSRPGDFMRMLTGIGDDTEYFRDTYYLEMANWYREYESTYNDSRTIIRVNAFLRILSFGQFHVHTVFMCFISLIGLVCIYRVFAPHMDDRRLLLFAAVFLLPSVLFWGSGVLKESIMLFGLGVLVYCYHRWLTGGFSLRRLLLVLFALGVLLVTKYYILASLLIGLIANAWIYSTGKKYPLLKYLTVTVLLTLGAWVYTLFNPAYNPFEILAQKQHNFINLAKGGVYLANDSIVIYLPHKEREKLVPTSNDSIFGIKEGSSFLYFDRDNMTDTLQSVSASDTVTYELWWNIVPSGSRIELSRLEPSIGSFLRHTPEALFNSFFRPHLLEARSPVMLVSAAENLLLLLLLLLCIFFYRKHIPSRPLLYFSISFTLVLFALSGLVTPVLGALVRYKMPALPFLAAALVMAMDKEKVMKRLPFLHLRKGSK